MEVLWGAPMFAEAVLAWLLVMLQWVSRTPKPWDCQDGMLCVRCAHVVSRVCVCSGAPDCYLMLLAPLDTYCCSLFCAGLHLLSALHALARRALVELVAFVAGAITTCVLRHVMHLLG